MRLTTIALCLAALLPADIESLKNKPKAAPPDSLVGLWHFDTSDGETPLRGTVSVWQAGASLAVHWSGAAESEDGLSLVLMSGTGIRDGDSLAISWASGKGHGVSLFRVEDGGKTLRGRWIPAGSGRATEEVWRWIGKHKAGKGA